MFKKKTVPDKKPFSLRKDEIMADIERIYTNEDQRNKLYYCLDDKPPHDDRFKKLDEFLKGNVDLESVSDNLESLTEELEKLSREIREQLEQIRTKSAGFKNT